MEAQDLAQVSDSLRKAVQGGNADHVRRAVDEFGWHELLEEDAQAAVTTLFSLQGELLLPESFLDDVLLAASGLELPGGTSVMLPGRGSTEPTSRLNGDEVDAEGVVRVGSATALVPCVSSENEFALVTVDLGAPRDDATGTIDPDGGWIAVAGPFTVVRCVARGADAVAAWQRMAAAGKRALTHELAAVGGEMLRMTLDHVTTREQFGRALGSFQSVKHKLADVRLWQEVALLSVEASWEDQSDVSATLAKAAGCRFTKTAREHCQQLLGGMGFTWEHSFHTYLRRALVLESLLGSASAQHRLLGSAVRDGAMSRELAGL